MSADLLDWRAQLVGNLPMLRAFARSLTRNYTDADDLVQETVAKALAHCHQFQAGTNLRAWLFTIQRNAFYSNFRRGRREQPDIDGEHAAALVTPANQEWVLALKETERAIQLLPRDQREAMALVVGAGMTYEDAARVCKCATGTIKSRLARGRARLVEMLDHGYQPTPRTAPAMTLWRHQHREQVACLS